MEQEQYTTRHQKGKHLNYDERMIIQLRLQDGWSPNQIARELGCVYNTVKNEIQRGTVELYHKTVKRYKAKAVQMYEVLRISQIYQQKISCK